MKKVVTEKMRKEERCMLIVIVQFNKVRVTDDNVELEKF